MIFIDSGRENDGMKNEVNWLLTVLASEALCGFIVDNEGISWNRLMLMITMTTIKINKEREKMIFVSCCCLWLMCVHKIDMLDESLCSRFLTFNPRTFASMNSSILGWKFVVNLSWLLICGTLTWRGGEKNSLNW